MHPSLKVRPLTGLWVTEVLVPVKIIKHSLEQNEAAPRVRENFHSTLCSLMVRASAWEGKTCIQVLPAKQDVKAGLLCLEGVRISLSGKVPGGQVQQYLRAVVDLALRHYGDEGNIESV